MTENEVVNVRMEDFLLSEMRLVFLPRLFNSLHMRRLILLLYSADGFLITLCGLNTKQAPDSPTRPRWSPSAKVFWTRKLRTKVSSRRVSPDYGWSIRGNRLLEDGDGIDPAVEYGRIVELEKLHGRGGTGFCGETKQDIIRSCISCPVGDR